MTNKEKERHMGEIVLPISYKVNHCTEGAVKAFSRKKVPHSVRRVQRKRGIVVKVYSVWDVSEAKWAGYFL